MSHRASTLLYYRKAETRCQKNAEGRACLCGIGWYKTMTDEEGISIVQGYHVVTPEVAQAVKAGLKSRFAVIFHSDVPGHDYMYFQASLFMDVLSAVSEQIDYDDIRIEVDENIEYQAIALYGEHLLQSPEEDRDPPLRIHFRKEGRLVCIEETEFWVMVGGLQPYSDSYTASFYSQRDMSAPFDAACSAACSRAGAVIRDRLQASPVPVRSPWWKKLWDVVR